MKVFGVSVMRDALPPQSPAHLTQDERQVALRAHEGASEMVDEYDTRQRRKRKRKHQESFTGLASRRRSALDRLFGEGDEDDDGDGEDGYCFGCDRNLLEKEGSPIPQEAVREMLSFMRSSMGCMGLSSFAAQLSRMHERMAQAVNEDAPEDKRIPGYWSPRMVKRHYRQHVLDPQVQSCFDMMDLMEIKQHILGRSLIKRVRRDDGGGDDDGDDDGNAVYDEIIDKDQLACLERVYKLLGQMANQDPKKSVWYGGDKMLNIDRSKQWIKGASSLLTYLKTDT